MSKSPYGASHLLYHHAKSKACKGVIWTPSSLDLDPDEMKLILKSIQDKKHKNIPRSLFFSNRGSSRTKCVHKGCGNAFHLHLMQLWAMKMHLRFM